MSQKSPSCCIMVVSPEGDEGRKIGNVFTNGDADVSYQRIELSNSISEIDTSNEEIWKVPVERLEEIITSKEKKWAAIISYQEAFAEIIKKNNALSKNEIPVLAMMGGDLPKNFFRFGFSADQFAQISALYLRYKHRSPKIKICCIIAFDDESLRNNLGKNFFDRLSEYCGGDVEIETIYPKDNENVAEALKPIEGKYECAIVLGYQSMYLETLRHLLTIEGITIVTNPSYFVYKTQIEQNDPARFIILNRAGYFHEKDSEKNDYLLFAQCVKQFCEKAVKQIKGAYATQKGQQKTSITSGKFLQYIQECHFFCNDDFGTIAFREDGEIFFPVCFFDGSGKKIDELDFREITFNSKFDNEIPKGQIAAQLENIDKAIAGFSHKNVPRDLKSVSGDSLDLLLKTFSKLYEDFFSALLVIFTSCYPGTVKNFYLRTKDEEDNKLNGDLGKELESLGTTSDLLLELKEFSNVFDDKYVVQINCEDDDIEDNNALRFYIVKRDGILTFSQFYHCITKSKRTDKDVIFDDANYKDVTAVIIAKSKNIAAFINADFDSKYRGNYNKEFYFIDNSCYFPCRWAKGPANMHKIKHVLYFAFKVSSKSDIRFIYFIPATKFGEQQYGGGVVAGTKDKLTLFASQFFRNSVTRVLNEIFTALQLNTIDQAYSKSAVGSIMSRNGSHNIGSHVLSALTANNGTAPADRMLYQYLQHRMDYTATVTTSFPTWSTPRFLVSDIIKDFLKQKHLLEYISKSEGLGAYLYNAESSEQTNKIKFFVRRFEPGEGGEPKDHLWQLALPGSNAKVTSFFEGENLPGDQDAALAIRGGVVGQHAFFTILENIIRNSAKHGWGHDALKSKDISKNLEIHIDFIDDPSSDNVEITIWDNVSDVMEKVKKSANTWDWHSLRKLLKIMKDCHAEEVEWAKKQALQVNDKKQVAEWNDLISKVEQWRKLSEVREAEYDLEENDEKLEEKLNGSQWEDFRHHLSLYELLCVQKALRDDPELLLPLHWQQQLRLAEPFIRDGMLRKEFWGLAEMKVSAGYLQGNSVSQIGGLDTSVNNSLKSIILPVAMGENGENAHWHLGYRFCIPKPKEILLEIGEGISEAVKKEFKKQGIYLKTTSEIKESGDWGYNFVVLRKIDGSDDKWKVKAPFRLLTYEEKLGNQNHDMVVHCAKLQDMLKNISTENIDKIREAIYEAWLGYLKNRRGIAGLIKVQLYIGNEKQDLNESKSYLWQIVLDTMLPVLEPEFAKNKDACSKLKEWLTDENAHRELLEAIDFHDALTEALIKALFPTKVGRKGLRSQGGEKDLLRKGPFSPPRTPPLFSKPFQHFRFCNMQKQKCRLRVLRKRIPTRVGNRALIKEGGAGFQQEGITPLCLWTSYQTLTKMHDKIFDTLPSGYKNVQTNGEFKEEKEPIIGVQFSKTNNDGEPYHIICKRHDMGDKKEGITKYQEALSGEQSYFTQLIQLYNNVKNNVDFAVRFVESALMRVLIIDERVCEYMKKKKSASLEFRGQGIWAIDTTKFFQDLQSSECKGSSNAPTDLATQMKTKDLLEININNFNKFCSLIEKKDNEAYRSEDFKIFKGKDKGENKDILDMIIIHQGMIDKCLPSKSPESISEFLRWLKEQCPYVVVTTGRGTPANIPPDARILPFASIQDALMRNKPEKLVLINTIMNILPLSTEKGVIS